MSKNIFMMYVILILAFSGVVNAKSTSAMSSSGKEELSCDHVAQIAQAFLSVHVKYTLKDLPPELRFSEQYLKRLDSSKVYLLKSDADEIKEKTSKHWSKILSHSCSFLDDVQKIVQKRVKERAEFAKSFLGANYKFDSKVSFEFDPDKKSYPKTKKEAEEFLKKYLHFQISNYLSADTPLEEAKTNVIKSWDKLVKRTGDVSSEDTKEAYLKAFALTLDPHSSFFSRDDYEDFEITMRLSLEGIGATLSNQDGFTVIEALVPGGSAARSGLLQPQDKIVAVGQGEAGPVENVIDQDLRDVVKKIRGNKGTTVRLSILRKKGDTKEKFEVLLVRDKINLEDEAASISYIDKQVGGETKKIAILNLPSFYGDSSGSRSAASDMKKLIMDARQKKADGMVLDLASNGGGSLPDAVKIAGLFFQTGNVVKQGARGDSVEEQVLRDKDTTVDWPGPLVVLTNRASASASEIVAGTLKDYRRAVIVGNDHTFGKGSVQTVLPIPNLGGAKVTIGLFFTAGGNSTQHRGVDSDVMIPGPYEMDEVAEKTMDYSLAPKSIKPFLSEEAYVKEGPDAWKPIETDWVKKLKDQSKKRVAKNDEFKKIAEDLKKAKAKGKWIKLSEIINDKDAKEKKEKAKAAKNASKEEKLKEYLKRADVQEAADVLSDLMAIETGKPLTVK